jgi:soluble lytic murein transglycosylase-like protein
VIRETSRRLFLLAVVGAAAAGWMIAFNGTVVPAIQTASAASAAPAPHVAPCPFPRALRPAFEAASRDAAVPPALLYAVAKVESNLRADAESEAGARGLLQLMPATGRSLALNIDEPVTNVLAGARYLRQLLDRFGSSDLALASYNAGPTAVTRAGGAPSIAVQRYVANVNRQWHSIAGCR